MNNIRDIPTDAEAGTALIPVLDLNGKAMLAWAVLTAGALAFGGAVVPYA